MGDAAPSSPPTSVAVTRRLWARLALSAVLGAIWLAFTWQRVDVVPKRWALPWPYATAYFVCLCAYYVTRAARWHFLVHAIAPVPARVTIPVAWAGFAWIAMLPLRLGELARPLFLAQKSPVNTARGLGTVALERVVDGLLVCALFFVGATTTDTSELAALRHAGMLVTVVFATALLLLLAMARWPQRVGDFTHRAFARLAPALGEKLGTFAAGLAQGLAALPSARPVAAFVGVTLVYWTTNALAMWVLGRGLGLELGALQIVWVMAVMNLALLIPGGPAQVGNFQAGVALGLAAVLPADTVRDAGSVFVFYLYVGQLGVGLVLALWAHHKLDLDWRAVMGLPSSRSQQTPREA